MPLGRLPFASSTEGCAYADIYLVTHKAGIALAEVWLAAPPHSLDVTRWIGWLDPEAPDGYALRTWRMLAGSEGVEHPAQPDFYLPLSILRVAGQPLSAVRDRRGQELVRLLHLDRSGVPFKPGYVEQELERDFCLREDALSLLSRRGAIDLHVTIAQPAEEAVVLGALPLLITAELLALERGVLRRFNSRLAGETGRSLDSLVQLKREVLDGLEEYYGTLATSTAFSAEATAQGEELFGIVDLYDAVMARLEMVTFKITTGYQRNTSRLGFWLTTLFGAIETGFVAASIATWYYTDSLWAVLAWTVGVTLATGVCLALVLKRFRAGG
ncbi:MAG: hypothetical protein EPO20_14185 [Betaproteobacteria bacterium]|nr:MAG: hypothetical protein EPO20_14185 [Betaproteobacteria bacterium]